MMADTVLLRNSPEICQTNIDKITNIPCVNQ